MKTLLFIILSLGLISCQERSVGVHPVTNSKDLGQMGQMIYKAIWYDGVYCLCFDDENNYRRCYHFVIPESGAATQVMGDDGKPLRCRWRVDKDGNNIR